jgi:hypothetical protein
MGTDRNHNERDRVIRVVESTIIETIIQIPY